LVPAARPVAASASQLSSQLLSAEKSTIIACGLNSWSPQKGAPVWREWHMQSRLKVLMTFFVLAVLIGIFNARAGEVPGQFVLLVELEIDPAQLDAYKAAMKEVMNASIAEPGVLGLNAVAEKDAPDRIRFLEIYSTADAFKAHLETQHVKKYIATTKEMVKSRKRIEVVPLMLVTK
jgi:quinol monooxygenase YgiN